MADRQVNFVKLAGLVENNSTVAIDCIKDHVQSINIAFEKIRANNEELEALRTWFKQQDEKDGV